MKTGLGLVVPIYENNSKMTTWMPYLFRLIAQYEIMTYIVYKH